MDMIMIVEIVVGIVVLAGAVRFAVRDVRQRRHASLQQQYEPAHTPEPEHTSEVQERSSEREVEQPPSEVADRT
jgi:flagellar biosynthesis/type III secretory pathway M-ring protein FliF/YscJ